MEIQAISADTIASLPASHALNLDSFPKAAKNPLDISVLYIFAGIHRKSDVGDLLFGMQTAGKASVHVLELDLLRSPLHDVTNASFWKSIILRIKQREFAVVIATPPCNTHSRARNANRAGPPPLRSRAHPYGYPWLSGSQLQEVEMERVHETRMTIAPPFTLCQVDLLGPFVAQCEHNHRSTVKVWGVIFNDPGSGAVFVGAMSKCDTSSFLQAYTRFSARFCHPQ